MNRWLARGGQAYAAGVRTHKVRVAVAAMVAYDAAPHPQHGEKPALMVQTLAKRLLARIKSDAGAGAEGAESLLERLQPLGDVRQANAELLSKVAALEAELKALKARRGWNNSAAHTIAPYNCCAHFVPAGPGAARGAGGRSTDDGDPCPGGGEQALHQRRLLHHHPVGRGERRQQRRYAHALYRGALSGWRAARAGQPTGRTGHIREGHPNNMIGHIYGHIGTIRSSLGTAQVCRRFSEFVALRKQLLQVLT
jgi:hypothetical protein